MESLTSEVAQSPQPISLNLLPDKANTFYRILELTGAFKKLEFNSKA